MITIICATHRPKNQTLKIVSAYNEILRELGANTEILQMSEMPREFLWSDSFGERTPHVDALIKRKLLPATKFVIIAPEYHGSYPGVFKSFVDALPPAIWKRKKVALVGVASGRAGNLRGMDHLTDLFHHMRTEVFSNKLPISKLEELLDEKGTLSDQETIDLIRIQAQEFLVY